VNQESDTWKDKKYHVLFQKVMLLEFAAAALGMGAIIFAVYRLNYGLLRTPGFLRTFLPKRRNASGTA